MNTPPLLLLIVTLMGCGYKDSEPVTAAEVPSQIDIDWTSLFDGETFEHWRGYKQDTMPEGWVVDDGAMFASIPGQGMDIVSREPYTDFELELEWRVKEGGNSGIMWHVDEAAGDYPWMTGPEYQILDDAAHNGGEIGKNSAGSNYDVQAPIRAMTKPAGEWNAARVVVNGSSVEHWLNGEKVVSYEKGSADHKERVAASKWAEMPSYGSTSTGHIAFQGDHGEVWFRNLRIRSL
jgi:hypothetical protein